MENNKLQNHDFTFVLPRHDEFPLGVEIYRDGKLYSIFMNESFLKPDSLEKFNEMPKDEKVCLWHHIKYYGNTVDDHEVSIFS